MRIVRPNWRENKRICVALTVLGNNVAFTFHRLLTKAGSWHLFFKSLYHGNIQNLNDEEKMAKNWARGDGEGGRANSADWKLDTILIASTIVIAIIDIKIVTIVCQLSPHCYNCHPYMRFVKKFLWKQITPKNAYFATFANSWQTSPKIGPSRCARLAFAILCDTL